MKNMIDYVEKEMDGFSAKKFNAVDSLVLSQLSYIHFEQMVPDISDTAPPVRIRDMLKAEKFGAMFRDVRDEQSNRRLLFALAASPRFRDIKINYYISKFDSKQEKQFSAVTFLLNDATSYIAFRGTDATFIGWKEDFNMAFISPIPSQQEGVRYLNAIAGRIPGKLRVGGHSKGGNIAVYSAMECNPSVQERISDVFSHDGPGFKDSVFQSPQFLNIRERIHKTLPQSSLIGMLLQTQENYSVVESNRFGIMQHDPFSWSVEDDDFSYAKKITNSASYRSMTLNQWLSTLTDEKRELFVDVLFQIIGATEAQTVYELSEDWKKGALSMIEAVRNIDPETKKSIMQTIKALAMASAKNLRRPKRKDDKRVYFGQILSP